jgi:DNA-binding MarR family transcriptional regulator
MPARTREKATDSIANAVHSAAIHLLRRLRKEDEHAGVGPARLSVLSVLVFGGPMRLTDLARIEQVKPPTMTKLVAGLEADRLVRRRADRSDARACRVEPTRRGTTLLHEGRRRRVDRLAAALRTIPRDERAVLARAAAIIERLVPTL